MKRHTQKVAQATLAFNPADGTTSISIKDKDLFPDGFLYTFPKGSTHSDKVRHAFTAKNDTEGQSLREVADEMYDQVRTDRHTSWNANAAYYWFSGIAQHRVFLGVGEDGQIMTRQAFAQVPVNSEPKDRTPEPLNTLIYGPSATGKTTLMSFLFRQYRSAQPQNSDLVHFGMEDPSRMSTVVRRNHRVMESRTMLDALGDLYDTTTNTVVFVDALNVTGTGQERVLAGALESLIRSRENPYLSFIVTKNTGLRSDIPESEKRFYNALIQTETAKSNGRQGSYLITDSAQGYREHVMVTPSWEKMFDTGSVRQDEL